MKDSFIPTHSAERRLWFYLMAFKACCGIAALVAAIKLSLAGCILVVAGLFLVMAGADGSYKSAVFWIRARERQLAARLRRQQAAQQRLEELERIQAAQQDASEKYFDESTMTLGRGMATGFPAPSE